MTEPMHLPWLLVATPLLQDDHFKHTVVLVVEQSKRGAMGFVMNRPVGQSVKDIVQTDSLEIPCEIPSWYGGPVGNDNGIILHNRPEASAFDEDEFEGHFALTASEDALREMVEYTRKRLHHIDADAPCRYPYRFIVGYAGWQAGQLEAEMREGAWIQIPFSEDLIFDTPWNQMWDMAMSLVGIAPHQYAPADQNYLI